MTLEDIERLPKDMLLAEDVSEFLGANPDILRWQAQHEPEKLGFPVIVTRSRVRIPREGFVYYCRFGRMAFESQADRDRFAGVQKADRKT